jgi:hypothetical protein
MPSAPARLPSALALLRARLALGVIGLVLTLPAIPLALSLGTGGPLDPVGPATRDLARALDRMDAALSRVQAALVSAGGTLDGARASLADGASASTSLSTAMDDLASASSVEFLGVRPFAGVAPRFSELAERARALATSLQSTQDAVVASRTDLDRLQQEVSGLADALHELGAGQAQQQGIGGLSSWAGRFFAAALLAWLAAVSAVWLVDSLRLLRLRTGAATDV